MRTQIKRVVSISLVALTLAACRGAADANAVHVGVILSLTGAAAPYGIDNQRGLQLAAAEINAKGGIGGRHLVLDVQDDAGDAAQAVTLAKQFATHPEVIAILGPTRTGSTVAVAKALPQLKLPMISVGATGDWASAAGEFNPWTFRSTRVDTYLVEPLLAAARDRLRVNKIAILYTIDDDWSKSVLKSYEAAAQRLGLQVVATESQRTGDADRSAQLTKIKAANPDALIINTLATDAPTIASQARRLGIKARFLGTAGFTNPQTWKLADPGALDSTLVADNYYTDSPRAEVRRFVTAYDSAFHAAAPPYAAYAYDGLNVLADACKRATPCSDRSALRTAIGSTSKYPGVLGSLTYQDKGDAAKEPILLTIQGAKYALFH